MKLPFITLALVPRSRLQIYSSALIMVICALSYVIQPALSRPASAIVDAKLTHSSSSQKPLPSDFPFERVDFLVRKRRGEEARRLIDKVKQTPANKDLIHLWRGLSYRADREPELAVAEYDQCTSLADGLPWAPQVAGPYAQVERYDKAVAIISAAIARQPSASLYGDRAGYLCGQGKFAEAIPDYKKAATFKDASARDYLTGAAELLRRQGKSKEGIAVLDEGLAISNKLSDGKYWLCRANCMAELGDWSSAAANCTKGVEIAQIAIKQSKWSEEVVLAQILVKRASCYDHLGKKDLAAQDRKAHAKIGASTEDIIIGRKK